MDLAASEHIPRRRCCFAKDFSHGFTLVEVLVALSVMALLAVLNWQGLDSMSLAQAKTRRHMDSVLTLGSGLSQWTSDLDAIAPIFAAPMATSPSPDSAVGSQRQPMPLHWNGRALRITRQSASGHNAGLRVVAWSSRTVDGSTQWLRWESPPFHTRGEWQDAWDQAARWAQSADVDPLRREIVVLQVLEWHISFYRNNAWTNPLSSNTQAAALPYSADTRERMGMPDGVRVVLQLAPDQAISGTVSRDWVRPTLSRGRS